MLSKLIPFKSVDVELDKEELSTNNFYWKINNYASNSSRLQNENILVITQCKENVIEATVLNRKFKIYNVLLPRTPMISIVYTNSVQMLTISIELSIYDYHK